eukprot:CAMPEP_0182441752 /NCGR_PEP_ID=MMETSP1172-20130603/756_1 /TAXON_ID=708627 /ORGANISM="Timspurckia oligopyrenoides, Strain CCMP3278" /LENGTH=94 /DNA_ID=CAMNT_0024636269 /DNA_START=232 /DNA_END=516 /DNA_ORIENTATION=-
MMESNESKVSHDENVTLVKEDVSMKEIQGNGIKKAVRGRIRGGRREEHRRRKRELEAFLRERVEFEPVNMKPLRALVLDALEDYAASLWDNGQK